MAPIIMNCINSSVEGAYPFVTSHILPNASHDAGEVGSNVDISKLSSPACVVALVLDSRDVTEASGSFEDVFAAIDDDLDIGSLLVDVDENSAFGSRGVEGMIGEGLTERFESGPEIGDFEGEGDRKSRPNSSFPVSLAACGLVLLSSYRVRGGNDCRRTGL